MSAMSDSDTPQPDPADVKPESAPPAAQRDPAEQRDHAGKRTRTVLALLVLAVGTIGSVLGAHAVAHNDATKTRQAFNQTSAGIGSTLTLAIQREQDLATYASTFFSANPSATPAQFHAWTKSTNPLHRFPELERIGLVALVRAPELAEFKARLSGQTVKARPSRSASSAARQARVSAGASSYHCYAIAGLARGLAKYPPAGLNYCTQIPGLLASRDSGLRTFVPVSTGRTGALGVETPVYRGAVAPSTSAGRRGAFVGWLHEVLVPAVVLQNALSGHPGSAARLSYRMGAGTVTATSGTPQHDAQSATVNLRNGWTATLFGAPADAGVFADGPALALLLAGILLSALLGLLTFLLGAPHPAESAPVAAPVDVPHIDLYDALTGLPNRALTLDLAERVVARTGRLSGMLAGALVIDIDWFKDVNEKLGQAAGDQALKILVQRLTDVVRTGDTLGRLGGDEFVILVESQARGIRLDSLARRVIEALHTPVELEDFGPSFFLTASIGVAFGRYATPDELLRDARLALQASKAAGKDRYTLFNANMRSVTEGSGMLEVDLNTALDENQFFLEYQPISNLNTQRVVGMEALIRWRHPKQGVLAPAEFIAMAEESGLIVPIGRWVLEQACSSAAAWNVAGHQVGVSVMVSTNQLNRDGFTTDVRRALQQSGIEPSLLTLEIDEATVMLDVPAFGERVQELKRLGVRIAIDNFGNGYAHRSAIQQMPLDFLKVDRSSLAESEDEDYRSWLLEAILHFGRESSLAVIAKGVQTAEQVSTLREIGCSMAQGFYLGKPTPADAVERLLEADVQATLTTSTPSLAVGPSRMDR
jgi:diguanylate cyclase (GGDEF)-like protein